MIDKAIEVNGEDAFIDNDIPKSLIDKYELVYTHDDTYKTARSIAKLWFEQIKMETN